MSDKLKPCPFCGADAARVEQRQSGLQIICGECRNGTPAAFESKKLASEAWNRRAALAERSEG